MRASVRISLLLVVALAGTVQAVGAGEPDAEEEVPGDSDAKQDEARWGEQERVRVVLDEVPAGPIGASSAVVDPDRAQGMPSALTDLVSEISGVSQNGQAGLFQVFSIRGVSRQRVASFVSGMRINGERRAGVSTSFIDPTLIGSVDILRGPSTTFFGSGAMGGVVEVEPREFSGWSFGVGYDTVGDENYQAVGVGGEKWSLGVARRDAGNAESAAGTVLNSHFTQYSAAFRFGWGGDVLRYELQVIPTYGEDIGKANTDFPERTTNYPLERHGLVRFAVESERGWGVEGGVHAHDLETEVVEAQVERATVFNDSFDFTLRGRDSRDVGPAMTVRYGLDVFGRRNVNAREVAVDLGGSSMAELRRLQSLDDANETELGAYAAVRGGPGKTRWEVGTRFSWLSQSNSGARGQTRSAWNGFVGVSHTFGEDFELRGALSSGERFPSLTELFFTGTTGRGRVIGNPTLVSERSSNAEATLRWTGRGVVIGGTVFRNSVDDYIERVEIAPDVLSFVNITSGTITGLELDGLWRPGKLWNVNWGGHLIEGEDSEDNPLADTPPNELFVGTQRPIGNWGIEGRLARRFERAEAASGEKPIPAATLLGAALTYGWSGGWTIALSASNLLDEIYFVSADRKAPVAPGRAFAVQFVRRAGARGGK